MECILEAHPVPDITWYQGTKIITDNSRIKMFRKSTGRDTYLLTLEISNPTKADGGNYRCNAFNNFGESNANISLNFQGKSTRQGGCSRLQNRCMSAIHSQRREIQLLYCPITFFLQFTAIATNYRNLFFVTTTSLLSDHNLPQLRQITATVWKMKSFFFLTNSKLSLLMQKTK